MKSVWCLQPTRLKSRPVTSLLTQVFQDGHPVGYRSVTVTGEALQSVETFYDDCETGFPKPGTEVRMVGAAVAQRILILQ